MDLAIGTIKQLKASFLENPHQQGVIAEILQFLWHVSPNGAEQLVTYPENEPRLQAMLFDVCPWILSIPPIVFEEKTLPSEPNFPMHPRVQWRGPFIQNWRILSYDDHKCALFMLKTWLSRGRVDYDMVALDIRRENYKDRVALASLALRLLPDKLLAETACTAAARKQAEAEGVVTISWERPSDTRCTDIMRMLVHNHVRIAALDVNKQLSTMGNVNYSWYTRMVDLRHLHQEACACRHVGCLSLRALHEFWVPAEEGIIDLRHEHLYTPDLFDPTYSMPKLESGVQTDMNKRKFYGIDFPKKPLREELVIFGKKQAVAALLTADAIFQAMLRWHQDVIRSSSVTECPWQASEEIIEKLLLDYWQGKHAQTEASIFDCASDAPAQRWLMDYWARPLALIIYKLAFETEKDGFFSFPACCRFVHEVERMRVMPPPSPPNSTIDFPSERSTANAADNKKAAVFIPIGSAVQIRKQKLKPRKFKIIPTSSSTTEDPALPPPSQPLLPLPGSVRPAPPEIQQPPHTELVSVRVGRMLEIERLVWMAGCIRDWSKYPQDKVKHLNLSQQAVREAYIHTQFTCAHLSPVDRVYLRYETIIEQLMEDFLRQPKCQAYCFNRRVLRTKVCSFLEKKWDDVMPLAR